MKLTSGSNGHRFFPYWITVSSLTIVFIVLLLWLISQRRLLPSIVILGAFMFFVLWLVGLIVVSIEMWSASGSVSNNCDVLVFNNPPTGQTLETLAWLEQRSICKFLPLYFAFFPIFNFFQSSPSYVHSYLVYIID